MFPSCVTLRARAGVMRLLASRVDSSGAIQLGAEFAKTIQLVPTGLAARNRGTYERFTLVRGGGEPVASGLSKVALFLFTRLSCVPPS